MSLIGILFGRPPASPPPPAPTPAPEPPRAPAAAPSGDAGASGSTSGGGSSASGGGASAPPPSAEPTPPAPPSAAPSASAAAASSAPPSSPSAGTPVTAPAVRFDFSAIEAPQADEDRARAHAIAAQKAWRMSEIVGALGAAPRADVSAEPARPDAAVSARASDLIDAVRVLRGAATPAA